MYLRDVFGRLIWEEEEVPETIIEHPNPIDPDNPITEVNPAYITRHLKLNPEYDPSMEYIPRTERPEWGCVGMMGKLVLIDDGTCQVNG